MLFLIVPPPVVQVTTDPDNLDTLIEGTYIDLVCNSSINGGVDTDISVTVVWSEGSDTIANGSGYFISNVKLVSGYYISTVRIEELEVTDDNAVLYLYSNCYTLDINIYHWRIMEIMILQYQYEVC